MYIFSNHFLNEKKGNNLLFSLRDVEMTTCVNGWCAVSVDNNNYMKTFGVCEPGCTNEDGKLVKNFYDDYYGDDFGKSFPDYDVEW